MFFQIFNHTQYETTVGEARVRAAFLSMAQLLETVCEQAIVGMNAGRSLAEIVRTLHVPSALTALPYLRSRCAHIHEYEHTSNRQRTFFTQHTHVEPHMHMSLLFL